MYFVANKGVSIHYARFSYSNTTTLYMVDGDLDRHRKGLTLQELGIETSTFATKITDKTTRDV